MVISTSEELINCKSKIKNPDEGSADFRVASACFLTLLSGENEAERVAERD